MQNECSWGAIFSEQDWAWQKACRTGSENRFIGAPAQKNIGDRGCPLIQNSNSHSKLPCHSYKFFGWGDVPGKRKMMSTGLTSFLSKLGTAYNESGHARCSRTPHGPTLAKWRKHVAKEPKSDPCVGPRYITDGEWKKVKENLASSGLNADDEWKKFKKRFARVGINVADTVKAELFELLLKSPCRDLTDDEWKEIKKCLARREININADTVKVQLFGHLWPLREAVPCLFRYSDVSEPRHRGATPRDLAKKQTTTIKHCNDLGVELVDLVNSLTAADILSKCDPMRELFPFSELTNRALTAQQHLNALVAELERCRDELMAMGANRGEHRRKTHREFWKKLARIFDAHVDNDVKFRNEHKISFLRACSVPFCPEVITDDSRTIRAFVESARSVSSK
jgi:hypothetical protein